MLFQQLATAFGQGHERRLLAANDVRPGLEPGLPHGGGEVSLSRARGTSALVAGGPSQGTTRKAPVVARMRTSDPRSSYRPIAVSDRLVSLVPRGRSRSRVNTSRGSLDRDSCRSWSPPLPRLSSGRSRSSDGDRCHATCRNSYTLQVPMEVSQDSILEPELPVHVRQLPAGVAQEQPRAML